MPKIRRRRATPNQVRQARVEAAAQAVATSRRCAHSIRASGSTMPRIEASGQSEVAADRGHAARVATKGCMRRHRQGSARPNSRWSKSTRKVRAASMKTAANTRTSAQGHNAMPVQQPLAEGVLTGMADACSVTYTIASPNDVENKSGMLSCSSAFRVVV